MSATSSASSDASAESAGAAGEGWLGCGGGYGPAASGLSTWAWLSHDSQPEAADLTPLWALKVIYFVGIGSQSCLFRFITVFFHGIGLDMSQIGLLQLMNPWVTFAGSLVWAAVCDRTGQYKRVLVATNALGAGAVCCLLLPAVQSSFLAVCTAMTIGPFLLSSRVGVNDALTLQVVEDYKAAEALHRRRTAELLKEGTEPSQVANPASSAPPLPSYGEQRLWGAAGYGGFGLLSGLATEKFGDAAMFAAFGACLGTLVLVVSTQLPSDGVKKQTFAGKGDASVCRFDILWFFLNLIVYGAHLALVESYLFVYLMRDFPGASHSLLGCSVAVMCAFELPVFFYMARWLERFSAAWLTTLCQVTFAVRVFAYSILPQDHPWLVLAIEPLHGITAAMMWSCSVEFGRKLAPAGMEARVQAAIGGVYYRVAQGLGAYAWGLLTRPAPDGFGFRAMYRSAACTLLLWAVVWQGGWSLRARLAGGSVGVRGDADDVPLVVNQLS